MRLSFSISNCTSGYPKMNGIIPFVMEEGKSPSYNHKSNRCEIWYTIGKKIIYSASIMVHQYRLDMPSLYSEDMIMVEMDIYGKI